jgi:dienelactone hydrolase
MTYVRLSVALALAAAACGADEQTLPIKTPIDAGPAVVTPPDAASDTPPPTVVEHIPITRNGCNPFGNAPRPVEPFFDDLWGPTCIGQGGRKMAEWQDSNGNTRESCLYLPKAASTDHKLPLVIYLHPSIAGPDMSLPITNVRAQLNTADLTGDPARAGFIMVAPYGRVTDRFYPFPDQGMSPGWDNWYRQVNPAGRDIDGQHYVENVDIASIDHYVAEVLATGMVDTSRVYVMGWSNGSAMATLYVLNRPNIAAAAIYSSPDPFQAFDDPCPQMPVTTYPKDDTQLQLTAPQVPIYQIHNDCDIGGICPNSDLLASSLADHHAGTMTMLMIDSFEEETGACLDACGTDPTAAYSSAFDLQTDLANLPGLTLGTLNHLRWPDVWTDSMFRFLRDHPLAQ